MTPEEVSTTLESYATKIYNCTRASITLPSDNDHLDLFRHYSSFMAIWSRRVVLEQIDATNDEVLMQTLTETPRGLILSLNDMCKDKLILDSVVKVHESFVASMLSQAPQLDLSINFVGSGDAAHIKMQKEMEDMEIADPNLSVNVGKSPAVLQQEEINLSGIQASSSTHNKYAQSQDSCISGGESDQEEWDFGGGVEDLGSLPTKLWEFWNEFTNGIVILGYFKADSGKRTMAITLTSSSLVELCTAAPEDLRSLKAFKGVVSSLELSFSDLNLVELILATRVVSLIRTKHHRYNLVKFHANYSLGFKELKRVLQFSTTTNEVDILVVCDPCLIVNMEFFSEDKQVVGFLHKNQALVSRINQTNLLQVPHGLHNLKTVPVLLGLERGGMATAQTRELVIKRLLGPKEKITGLENYNTMLDCLYILYVCSKILQLDVNPTTPIRNSFIDAL